MRWETAEQWLAPKTSVAHILTSISSIHRSALHRSPEGLWRHNQSLKNVSNNHRLAEPKMLTALAGCFTLWSSTDRHHPHSGRAMLTLLPTLPNVSSDLDFVVTIARSPSIQFPKLDECFEERPNNGCQQNDCHPTVDDCFEYHPNGPAIKQPSDCGTKFKY